MKKIIRAEDLPIDEKVYLKKGAFGYSVVQPVKNEDGSINWINMLVGGWGNLFKLLFILLVIFSFIYGVQQMMEGCNDMAESPCKYTNLDCTRYDNTAPNLDFGKVVIPNEQQQDS